MEKKECTEFIERKAREGELSPSNKEKILQRVDPAFKRGGSPDAVLSEIFLGYQEVDPRRCP